MKFFKRGLLTAAVAYLLMVNGESTDRFFDDLEACQAASESEQHYCVWTEIEVVKI
jgi:hypothetical protein